MSEEEKIREEGRLKMQLLKARMTTEQNNFLSNSNAQKEKTEDDFEFEHIFFRKREEEETSNQNLSKILNQDLGSIAAKKGLRIKDLLSNIVEVWLAEYDAKEL